MCGFVGVFFPTVFMGVREDCCSAVFDKQFFLFLPPALGLSYTLFLTDSLPLVAAP